MAHGQFFPPRLFKYLPKELGGLTILDVGCGLGEVAYYIQAMADQPYYGLSGHPRIVGVDINEPSLRFCQEYLLGRVYSEVYRCDAEMFGEVPELVGRRFDLAMLNEFMEHVERGKALRILGAVERVSDRVLVSTPLGDERRHWSDEYQEFNHVSMWSVKDFTARGYRVSVEDTLSWPNKFASLYKSFRRVIGKPISRKIIAVKEMRR